MCEVTSVQFFLVSRINALQKISRISSFKTRKMLANGMVISRLIYLIQLWGGCPGYLLNFLQVLQNRAARLVCKEGKFTPIKTLLENCGWLSIRQLVAFHRVLLVFKIRQEGKPKYFVEKFTSNSHYKTRFLDDGGIKKENSSIFSFKAKFCTKLYRYLEQSSTSHQRVRKRTIIQEESQAMDQK